MTLTAERPVAIPAGVGMATSLDGLSIIHQPECAAAIWQRPAPGFVSWLEALPAEHLPRARVILPADEVPQALEHLCDIAGTPDGPERQAMIEDASSLAERFADMLTATYLRLRLDVVQTNACRKFHVDMLTARLVCTYRGTGTQFGAAQDGSDPSVIHTVPAGSPAVMRGRKWPESPSSGLLHRSPPIEGTGETRLVLVLDPISDPDAAA